ncbi:hypothetical protein PU560_06380 [Georgenia sp. 10Sc9-8]|uniref:DUF222 domain-containing protein n=1 Tax=Georgenia halotolerans TaxID=3028317 RepID=A0ABT5TWK7_9MICO|nr:hypothetical protein [Georgenia halotolerans]
MRRMKAAAAAKVVPDMNLLHSRLSAQGARLSKRREIEMSQLDQVLFEVERDAHLGGMIVESSFDVGLKFANEIYLTRHFITAARHDLLALGRKIQKETGEESAHDLSALGGHSHSSREDLSDEGRLSKVAAHLLAADASLMAAEALLPTSVRTVDGKSFWDRYSSVMSERSVDAEKSLVDLRQRRRSTS